MSRNLTVLHPPNWPLPEEARLALTGLSLPVIDSRCLELQKDGFTIWTTDVVDELQKKSPELAHLVRLETSWHMPGRRCFISLSCCALEA